MNLSLKNFKFAAFASEETTCFQAVLCVDGKPSLIVSNNGHGGCDEHSPLNGTEAGLKLFRETLKTLEAHVKTLPPLPNKWEPEHPLTMNLDLLIGELVEAELLRKDFDREMKKCSFVVDGRLSYVKKAKVGDASAEAWVLKKYPQAIILNRLPRDAAFDAFKKVMQS